VLRLVLRLKIDDAAAVADVDERREAEVLEADVRRDAADPIGHHGSEVAQLVGFNREAVVADEPRAFRHILEARVVGDAVALPAITPDHAVRLALHDADLRPGKAGEAD